MIIDFMPASPFTSFSPSPFSKKTKTHIFSQAHPVHNLPIKIKFFKCLDVHLIPRFCPSPHEKEIYPGFSPYS